MKKLEKEQNFMIVVSGLQSVENVKSIEDHDGTGTATWE